MDNSGSIQISVNDGNDDTVVLTENFLRNSLKIKNIGQNLCFIALGQPGSAIDNGWPLEPNEYISWEIPASCPQGRVSARAQGGNSALAIIWTGEPRRV